MAIDLNSLIGLTEEAASVKIRQAGMTVRVTARNGESFMGTAEHDTNRVKLVIENDLVTSARIG